MRTRQCGASSSLLFPAHPRPISLFPPGRKSRRFLLLRVEERSTSTYRLQIYKSQSFECLTLGRSRIRYSKSSDSSLALGFNGVLKDRAERQMTIAHRYFHMYNMYIRHGASKGHICYIVPIMGIKNYYQYLTSVCSLSLLSSPGKITAVTNRTAFFLNQKQLQRSW